MVSLTSVAKRFELPFTVVEGGRGRVLGVLSETEQSAQPSYVFVQPRHVLRTMAKTALRAGMVIMSPSGARFIVGNNGPSEQQEGTIWQSFRLFEPTGRYHWQRRTQTIDPITRMKTEGDPESLGFRWVALEALEREQSDREMRATFEQMRFITGADIKNGDLIDNRIVSKVDKQLGLAIGIVT